MKGQYVVGTVPPVQINFTPFTAVIDLDDGVVLGRDTYVKPLTIQQVLTKVEQASTN